MLDRIKTLCKLRKTNYSQLEKTLGFANGSIKKTKAETISAFRLKKIADYFNVSMEFLMTGAEPAAGFGLSREEIEIIKAYRLKSDDAKDIIANALGVKRQDTSLLVSSKAG